MYSVNHTLFYQENKINTNGTIKALKNKKISYENEKKISSINYVYEMHIEEKYCLFTENMLAY